MKKIEASGPQAEKLVTKIKMGDTTVGELVKKIEMGGPQA